MVGVQEQQEVWGRTGPGEEGFGVMNVWVVREEITVDIRRFPARVRVVVFI